MPGPTVNVKTTVSANGYEDLTLGELHAFVERATEVGVPLNAVVRVQTHSSQRDGESWTLETSL